MSNATPQLKKVRALKATPANKLRFVIRDDITQYGSTTCLDTPEKNEAFFRQVVMTEENFEWNKEHVVVALVNTRLMLQGYNIVSVGTVNESNAHPREILRPVLMGGAYGFIMFHQHPSGDPSPSRSDEQTTRRMVEAAQLMQVRFLDHIIIGLPRHGFNSYYSFRESGLIP